MLRIERTATAIAPTAPSECLAKLAQVEAYPSWSSIVSAVEVLERRGDGSASRIALRARVLGLALEMRCAVELGAEGAALRRLPYDAGDDERFVAEWTIGPAAGGATVQLHVTAALDAPRPVRAIGGRLGARLVDGLLADFVRAAQTR